MEQIAVLDAVRLDDLAAAAVAGLCVSGGAVALGMHRADDEPGAAIAHRLLTVGIAAAALVCAVAGGALIVAGPWAPLVIASGLGLLAGPPFLQAVCRSGAVSVRRRFALLAGFCALAGAVITCAL